jgi:hypothetical protein
MGGPAKQDQFFDEESEDEKVQEEPQKKKKIIDDDDEQPKRKRQVLHDDDEEPPKKKMKLNERRQTQIVNIDSRKPKRVMYRPPPLPQLPTQETILRKSELFKSKHAVHVSCFCLLIRVEYK